MCRTKYILLVYVVLKVFLSESLYSQTFHAKKPLAVHHVSRITADSLFNEIDSLTEVSDILEIGTEFTSKVAFWGRDYEVQQIGFQPTFKYQTARGLFFTASQNYWSSDPKPLAKTYVGGGYQKRINSWLYTSLSYDRCIVHNDSLSTISEPENNLVLDLSCMLGWIAFEPSVNYLFGSQQFLLSDLMIRGEFKLFNFKKLGRVFFEPEIMMTSTTSPNSLFYHDPEDESETRVPPSDHINLKSLKIINYELTLPLAFNYKNFEIKTAFHYANPVKINSDEFVRPFSYFTISLVYTSFLSDKKFGRLFKQLKGN